MVSSGGPRLRRCGDAVRSPCGRPFGIPEEEEDRLGGLTRFFILLYSVGHPCILLQMCLRHDIPGRRVCRRAENDGAVPFAGGNQGGAEGWQSALFGIDACVADDRQRDAPISPDP